MSTVMLVVGGALIALAMVCSAVWAWPERFGVGRPRWFVE